MTTAIVSLSQIATSLLKKENRKFSLAWMEVHARLALPESAEEDYDRSLLEWSVFLSQPGNWFEQEENDEEEDCLLLREDMKKENEVVLLREDMVKKNEVVLLTEDMKKEDQIDLFLTEEINLEDFEKSSTSNFKARRIIRRVRAYYQNYMF